MEGCKVAFVLVPASEGEGVAEHGVFADLFAKGAGGTLRGDAIEVTDSNFLYGHHAFDLIGALGQRLDEVVKLLELRFGFLNSLYFHNLLVWFLLA